MEVWPRGLWRHPAKVQDSARGPESSNLSASATLEDWPSRLMAPVLKTGSPGRGSWVRILHLPQLLAQVAKRLTRRSAKPVSAGPNPALSSDASLAQLVEHLPCKQRVAGSIPVGGSSFICIFAPAKTILDMAQTFFSTTCWRSSSSFAGCVMSEKPNRHHKERISFRAERS